MTQLYMICKFNIFKTIAICDSPTHLSIKRQSHRLLLYIIIPANLLDPPIVNVDKYRIQKRKRQK